MKLSEIIDTLYLEQQIIVPIMMLVFMYGLFKLKKLTKPNRILLIILTLAIITEILGSYFSILLNDKKSNGLIYNLYTMISIPLILTYYRSLQNKFPFIPLIIAFVIGVGYFLIIDGIQARINPNGYIVSAVIILISIFFYFSNLIKNKKVERLSTNSSFLFSCGLLIFYVGLIPYIKLMDLLDLKDVYSQIIIISLNIILYASYFIAFLCNNQTQK